MKEVLVGVDEVGRGCLAGPLVACAFAAHPAHDADEVYARIPYLNDSKKLTEKQRNKTVDFIESHVDLFCYTLTWSHANEIDTYGIESANADALYDSALDTVNMLHEWRLTHINSEFMPVVVFDGNKVPHDQHLHQKIVADMECFPVTIVTNKVGADKSVPAVMAASILAKVKRDAHMVDMGKKLPLWNFEKHKGYGTSAHIAALKTHGGSDIHRLTFDPLRSMLEVDRPVIKLWCD
jgi:ribonuclease HII